MTVAERTANTLAELISAHRVVHVEMQQEHAVCIARVDMPEYGIKAGETFELVKAGSFAGYAYIIVYGPAGRVCSCPAKVQNCKHVKLASEIAVVRYYARKAHGGLVLEPVAVIPDGDQDAHVADDLRGKRFPTREQMRRMPLDNRGFSFMA